MIAQPSPYYYYETSNHTLKIANAGAVHIFPVIDTNRDTEDGHWTPDGVYKSGESNYTVVYCCDAITGTREDEEDITNTYYKRLNLEDSEYFSVEQAERLRAILSVSYPALSVEDAKVALKAAGFEQADMLDRSELIAATQGAIWRLVNADSIIDGVTDYRYRTTVSTSRKAGWGGYLHDYSGDQKNFTDGLRDTAIDEIGERINALQDFFTKSEDERFLANGIAKDGQIVITNLDIVSSKIFDAKDKYDVTLNVELNHGADADDEIYITAYVNDKSVKTEKVEGNTHSLKIEAAANDDIKVVVSGTQNLERGVYFYAPKPQDIDGDGIATSREVSQNLIGVSAGETPVYAEAEATIRDGNIIEKESTDLYNENYTDVTLSVNGDVEYKTDGGVDIVIALGAGIAAYDADNANGYTHTYDSIVSLVKPLVEKGINVKLGLIAVEHYDDVAMELTGLNKENYEQIITDGLTTIQEMPAGPTNLHGNIEAAKAMLDADTAVPAENKFFYVIGTGRTYNFDNEDGVPTTIINKLSNNGKTYYYWGHYLWQSQRGRHTSLYMIPDCYNNDFSAYWADVCKWVEADGDAYAYSFPNYDTANEQWFNSYMSVNSTDLKAHGVATSRYGWLIPSLTDSGIAAIGSGANPQNALNYERAQYEAYQTYQEMIEAGYTCEAICSETPNYLNESLYITLGMGYEGSSSIQLGHSFMDFLNGGDSKVLFKYIFDETGAPTAVGFETTDYFNKIDTTKLVGTGTASTPFVEDYIGTGDDYDFDFTGNVDKLVLKVNGVPYTTAEVDAMNGADATYTFANDEGKVGFKMDYFKGNGTTEERFVWYFLESLTGEDTVTLSYQLKLDEKNETVGTHIAETNISATLYPTGDRNYGQLFPVPEVIYNNYAPLESDKNSNEIGDNRFEISLEVPGGDAEVEHDEVILMVDGSYSMDEEWPAMVEAITTIGETVLDGSGHTVLTLMAFGMGDNEVLVHVKTVDELTAALGELPGTLLYGRSSTNCEAGFTGVAEYIANHDETLGDVEVIFISDGNLNTDETPRAFDANWKTWTKFGALAVAQETFGGTVNNGENLPAAFTTVFGDRFDGATRDEIIERAFGGEVSDEEFIVFAEQIWTDVYAYSGLTRGVEYPVSDAERAFVKYDKENGTYIQDLFYYTTYKSAYVTYGDRWTRTPVAADALAAMDEVTNLYVVDYDGYTAWMDTGITSEKSTFVQSNGIAGLVEALEITLDKLALTPYNDVVITDYMSKWVNLDASTLKIVDNKTGEVIWTAADGWLIDEGRPTVQEVPVIIELVDSADYAAGGDDVIGNTNGDIYKLTWYVKDGALLRSDNYKLVYEVTVDTAEEGFKYDKDYPANGNTDIHYVDGNGEKVTNEIKVPDVVSITGTVTLNKVDENGNLVSGAVFELYNIENGEERLVGRYELADGKIAIDGLAVGSYKLVEVQAPKGYIGIDKPMYFEIVKTSEGKLEVKNAYELEFPATAYEISNHLTSVAIPQTFVLLDADKADSWTYPGEFVFGESNYDVVYCADSETGVEDGTKYYRADLEDVFEEDAAKLSAIVANSYPYVSVEDMIAAATAAGVADADNLTRGDIIAAVQLAIWHYTNGIEDYTYTATYSVEAYPRWGKVFNDYSDELGESLPTGSDTTKIVDEASDARIRALYNYLLGLDTAEGDTDVFVYVPKDGKDASQMLIGGTRTNFYTNGMEISVVNVAEKTVIEEPETPAGSGGNDEPTEPEEKMTVSFKSGQASNISFMLIDPATGKVEFIKKIDIGSETSFEIPAEEGKISAVFVKQSTSGMFWIAEEVDEATVNAVIACLKANNPSYKGYNALAFGEGDHELEFKKNKFVTYTFTGCEEVTVDTGDNATNDEPVVDEPVVEELVVEEDNTSNKNNGNNKNKNKNK
ncbi:MAG: Cys-Gln thioester bond-forming surface protein [Clostridia bacterium]|nr:Cys-Gln thioester bond-forming surface protein [Clostridia bacterium]